MSNVTCNNHSLSNREQDTCQIDDAGHGDAGEEGAHHDELGREVFKIVKFDGVEDGIDGAGTEAMMRMVCFRTGDR